MTVKDWVASAGLLIALAGAAYGLSEQRQVFRQLEKATADFNQAIGEQRQLLNDARDRLRDLEAYQRYLHGEAPGKVTPR